MTLTYQKLHQTLEYLGYSSDKLEKFERELQSKILQRIGNSVVVSLTPEQNEEFVHLLENENLKEEHILDFFKRSNISRQDDVLTIELNKLLVETMDKIILSVSNEQREKITAILNAEHSA